MKQRVYLDSAAAHPVRPWALRAFTRASKSYGNPSAPHQEGQEALAILTAARTSIAREVGAKADAVVFTSGATESNALAIEGYIRAQIAEGSAPNELQVLYSKAQHASVIGAIDAVRALGVQTVAIPVADGMINLEELKSLLTPQTALVTLDAVCGETGTLFDTRAVRRLLDSHAGRFIPLHVDATQAPLVEPMDRTRLGADLISFDAQKIGGVRGIGALIVPSTITLAPIIGGGGQERSIRSGTPSPALAASFAAALTDASKERASFSTRAHALTQEIVEFVLKELPHTVINGGEKRAPHILNVSLLGRDTDYLAALLDEEGCAVATRSACETDAQGSRAVLAYTNDEKRAASTLRISLHAKSSAREVRAFLAALKKSVAFLDSVA